MYKNIYWNDNYKGREPINIKKHLNAFKNDLLKLIYGSDIKYEIQYIY